jgi:hypothetical protein
MPESLHETAITRPRAKPTMLPFVASKGISVTASADNPRLASQAGTAFGHISTSYGERQNLTMRASMRRFFRLTNAFSKKIENQAAAVALYFMFYNFARVLQTLRVTPAMDGSRRC